MKIKLTSDGPGKTKIILDGKDISNKVESVNIKVHGFGNMVAIILVPDELEVEGECIAKGFDKSILES